MRIQASCRRATSANGSVCGPGIGRAEARNPSSVPRNWRYSGSATRRAPPAAAASASSTAAAMLAATSSRASSWTSATSRCMPGILRLIRGSELVRSAARASKDRHDHRPMIGKSGGPASMTAAQAPAFREHGNAYNIFILVLTVFSLVVMALLLLPLSDAEHELLARYDNAICVVFLIDFTMNITAAKPKRRLLHRTPRLARPPRVPSRPSASFGSPRCSASPVSAGWPGSPACSAVRRARTWSSTCSRTAASTRRSSPSFWRG